MKIVIFFATMLIAIESSSGEDLVKLKPKGDPEKIAKAEAILDKQLGDSGAIFEVAILKEVPPGLPISKIFQEEIVTVSGVGSHVGSNHVWEESYLIGFGENTWILNRGNYLDDFFELLKNKNQRIFGTNDVETCLEVFDVLMDLDVSSRTAITQADENYLVEISRIVQTGTIQYRLSVSKGVIVKWSRI